MRTRHAVVTRDPLQNMFCPHPFISLPNSSCILILSLDTIGPIIHKLPSYELQLKTESCTTNGISLCLFWPSRIMIDGGERNRVLLPVLSKRTEENNVKSQLQQRFEPGSSGIRRCVAADLTFSVYIRFL
jgi:hypothetical protein